MQTLGDVENFFFWQTDALDGEPEIVEGRFVGLDLLGGDDPIERNFQVLLRSFEEVVVGVGEDGELVLCLEGAQGVDCIGKRQPVSYRERKMLLLFLSGRETQAFAISLQDRFKNGLVVAVGAAFGLWFEFGIEFERVFAIHPHVVRSKYRSEVVPDS